MTLFKNLAEDVRSVQMQTQETLYSFFFILSVALTGQTREERDSEGCMRSACVTGRSAVQRVPLTI